MKKAIAIFLIIVCCVPFVACGGKEEKRSETDYSPSAEHTHEFVEKETDYYLVKDGASDYVIVVPDNANEYETTAAEELQSLFCEATDIKLPVIKDVGIRYDENSTYISVGKTSLINDAGVIVDYVKLNINGVGLYTKGRTVFIVGGAEYGVVYAAYEFLYRTVGFEQFHTDYYYIDANVKDLKLMDYEITDVPDIKRFMSSIGYLTEDTVARRRMRAAYEKDSLKAMVKGKNEADHSTLFHLPVEKYGAEHPDWYSSGKTQLCYTAHGNSSERALMVETFVESVKQVIKDSPDKPFVPISNMDSDSGVEPNCTCDKCNETAKKYNNAISAAYIKFANDVYDKISEWFKTDEGKRYYSENFRIIILVYRNYFAAPATYNGSSGEYEPIDDSVKLRDGVIVEFAPITANYTLPLNSEVNSSEYQTLLQWNALAKETAAWTYSFYFNNYLLPCNTFNSMQFNYGLAADMNAQWIYDQTENGQYGGATGWQVLKTYLTTKLAWNTNYNVESLIKRFFKYYFGAAEDEMLEFFDSYRSFSEYQEETLKKKPDQLRLGQSVYHDTLNKKYWPKDVLAGWRARVEKAIEKITPLKENDITKYDVLYKHIVQERIFLDYALIELYSDRYDADSLKELKLSFKEAVVLNKLTATASGADTSISDYLNKLGV